MLKNTFNTYSAKYKYQGLVLLSHITFFLYCYLFGINYFIIAILSGWIVSNLAHYLYIHRIYTHKHFHLSETKHNIFMFLFTLLNLGSPAVYAATHIMHHSCSGKKGDPHDPYQLGFVRTFLSLWDKNFTPDRKLLARYLKDTTTKRFHTYHFSIAFVSAIFTPFFVVMGFYLSKISIIFVHIPTLGSRTEKDQDTSVNAWYLKPITWGEELHNNHHVNPGTSNHNFLQSFKEIDLLYYIGNILSDKK